MRSRSDGCPRRRRPASRSSSLRVDDEVAVDLADPHRAHGRGQRDVGDHQRGRGAVHGEDVVGVDVVDRERDRHQLRVVAPVLGEQRAQRAVDHARGQRALLARAALALEERAGDLAGRVHALLDIHRQREEVDVAHRAGDAVERTIVSPWRTTTAPEACLAILPVSNEISLPAISTDTRVTASLLIFTAFLFRPSVGGPLHVSLFPNHRSLADASSQPRTLDAQAVRILREGPREPLAQQLQRPAARPARRPHGSSARCPSGPVTISARWGKPPSWSTPKALQAAPLGSKSESCSLPTPSFSRKALCAQVESQETP